jgi:alpha-1,3-rhamnosyl/mannosyltransferase
MKIIINGHALKPPLTGIGHYTQCLLHGLQENTRIRELVCIPKININNENLAKKNYLPTQINTFIRSLPGTYAALNKFRNMSFRKKIASFAEKNFIYHEPSYILRPYSGPKICTVHDLSHIHYPQYHPRERVKFLLQHLALSIEQAQHIITGSHFVRREMIDFFKLPANKITTVYHGVAKIFRPRGENDLKPILARYQLLGKKYLLYIGTLEPRKNIERLIQAFYRLPPQWRKQYPLVLVGSKGWGSAKLEKLIHRLIKKEQFYYLGYVPEVDLPYLYSGAYAFLYLSLYEGFGLPVLEALASGIPCITSNVSSIPEVVGKAGLLVNPWDVDAITATLNRLISDPVLQADLRRKGPIQAAQFSWQTCINNTIDIYEGILASS